jgi:hypothetical protein
LTVQESLEAKKHDRDLGLIVGAKVTAWVRKMFSRSKKVDDGSGEEEALLGQHKNQYAGETAPKGKNVKPVAQPTMREVLDFQVTLNMVVYFLLAFYSIAYDQVCVLPLIASVHTDTKQLLPVFMHHRPQAIDDPEVSLPFKFAGGFGIDSGRIGAIFTVLAVVSTLSQFLLFPVMARYLGVLTCLRISFLIFPVVYFLTPFISLLPDQRSKELAMVGLLLFRGLGGCFAFPTSTIMLTNSASSLRVLGTINGLATSVSAIGRAIGPATSGWLFSWGVKHGYLIVPFWTLSAVALAASIPTWWLVEGKGFGDDPDSDVESVASASAASDDDAEEEMETEDAAVLSESEYGEPAGLLSRTSTRSSQVFGSEADSIPAENYAARKHRQRRESGPSLGQMGSHSPSHRPRRRSSIPVGMGQGFRRLSSNLGSTGFGSGGTSWGGT